MCSANVRNEPPYDPPTPQRPRTYLLSGSVPPARVTASIALAVIGEMLSEVETADIVTPAGDVATATLHEARRRIAEAEAEYADGTVRG